MTAYYNENDRHAAAWLRELIKANLIAPGIVDERDIQQVTEADVANFTQVHWFAGIGGWSYALRLAGIPDDHKVWTGSCPCQPYSRAGKGLGDADSRNLWPEMFRLIRKCRPERVFGEQTESAIAQGWLDGISTDLEGENYAVGSAVLGAHSVRAPHVRHRLWWFADSTGDGREGVQRCLDSQISSDRPLKTLDAWHGTSNPFEHWKKLLAESAVFRVDDGVSSMLDIRPRLRAFGNAICPQVAAAFITAAIQMEAA